MSEKVKELIKLMEEYWEQYPKDSNDSKDSLEALPLIVTVEKANNILKNRDGRRIVVEPTGELEIDGMEWKYE